VGNLGLGAICVKIFHGIGRLTSIYLTAFTAVCLGAGSVAGRLLSPTETV
jgi:hypothetical protein